MNYTFKLQHSIGKCDRTWYDTFPTQYWEMSPLKKIWHILLNKCHMYIGIMSALLGNLKFNLVWSRSLNNGDLNINLYASPCSYSEVILRQLCFTFQNLRLQLSNNNWHCSNQTPTKYLVWFEYRNKNLIHLMDQANY